MSLSTVAVGELSAHRGWWLSPPHRVRDREQMGPRALLACLDVCLAMAAELRRNKSTSEDY